MCCVRGVSRWRLSTCKGVTGVTSEDVTVGVLKMNLLKTGISFFGCAMNPKGSPIRCLLMLIA